MSWGEDRLKQVFQKTAGRCHVCRKQLAFKNYGSRGSRGAWEVDHSVPRANGGTDSLNNLLPACCSCNNSKSTSSTRSARSRAGHGKTRAPLSKEKQERARAGNTVAGGLAGATVGALLAGPLGAVVFGAAGLLVGSSADVE